LNAVDHAIEGIFGKRNAEVIYDHLEKNGCTRYEIPTKPEVFSMEIRNILGRDRGQILGAASILEGAILKALCSQLKTNFTEEKHASFAESIKRLREVYENEKSANLQVLQKGND
jgi:hypothetical protein